MASNQQRFVRSEQGAREPLIWLGNFQAGATQAIKRGEILELTAGGSTQWVPVDSDYAMSADLALANEEIKSGDRAGYYEIMVPRPGDVFEFELAAAGANAVGVSLYFSSSEKLTITAGTNVIAYTAGFYHYPQKQGHLADGDGSFDAGTTIRSVTRDQVCFKESVSFWKKYHA